MGTLPPAPLPCTSWLTPHASPLLSRTVRSPPGLAKTPLSALGLKPHNPADILLHPKGGEWLWLEGRWWGGQKEEWGLGGPLWSWVGGGGGGQRWRVIQTFLETSWHPGFVPMLRSRLRGGDPFAAFLPIDLWGQHHSQRPLTWGFEAWPQFPWSWSALCQKPGCPMPRCSDTRVHIHMCTHMQACPHTLIPPTSSSHLPAPLLPVGEGERGALGPQ